MSGLSTTHEEQRCTLPKHPTTKPQTPDYHRVPRSLWRRMKRHLPHEAQQRGPGRPRVENRPVVNGIWYVLRTDCRSKAVHRDWSGVSNSVLHERFQIWQAQGIWDRVFQTLVQFYARESISIRVG